MNSRYPIASIIVINEKISGFDYFNKPQLIIMTSTNRFSIEVGRNHCLFAYKHIQLSGL